MQSPEDFVQGIIKLGKAGYPVFTNWSTWSLILEAHAWLGSNAQFSQFITPFNAFLLVPMKYTDS